VTLIAAALLFSPRTDARGQVDKPCDTNHPHRLGWTRSWATADAVLCADARYLADKIQLINISAATVLKANLSSESLEQDGPPVPQGDLGERAAMLAVGGSCKPGADCYLLPGRTMFASGPLVAVSLSVSRAVVATAKYNAALSLGDYVESHLSRVPPSEAKEVAACVQQVVTESSAFSVDLIGDDLRQALASYGNCAPVARSLFGRDAATAAKDATLADKIADDLRGTIVDRLAELSESAVKVLHGR